MTFPLSGEYVVEGALCPVVIDKEKGLGRYVEPNVWVSYDLDLASNFMQDSGKIL